MNSIFKTILLLPFACAANVLAEECCEISANGCGPIALPNGRNGCVLQSEISCLDPCHRIELGVAAVYWRPYIEGTEYGWTFVGTDPTLPIEGSLLRVKPSFSWGFEANAGYLFCNDDWKADLAFTFHQGSGSNSFEDNWDRQIVPSTAFLTGIFNGVDIVSFSDAKAHVDSSFYRLSFLLSRGTFASRLLSVTPGFGLTATWLNIHQTNRFNNSDSHVFIEKKVSDGWDIGPTSFINTRLWFGDSGFSLMNAWDLTLGFGKTEIEQRCVYSINPGINHTKIHDDGVRLSPKTHMLLGLQYDTDCWNCTQHVTLMAGLDAYVMWAGNRTIRAINTRPIGALSIPTLGGQFEEKDASIFALVGLTVAFDYQF